jgi:hypothetical protein
MPIAGSGDGFTRREAIEDAHAAITNSVGEVRWRGILSQVKDGGYFSARVQDIERGGVAIGVCRGHHHALAGSHAELADEALRGGGKHHTREIVVAEDDRLLGRTRCQDNPMGADLVEAVSSDHRKPVVRKQPGADGIGHDGDGWRRRDCAG